MSEPVLLAEDLGPVRRLTMNRPASLNALDRELVDAMSTALDEAAEDEDVRVLILRENPAGLQRGLRPERGRRRRGARRPPMARGPVHSTEEMLKFLDHLEPVIASVHSYCLAGARDLMLACDLAVAADDAYFGYVDVRFDRASFRCSFPGSWASGRRRSCSSRARIAWSDEALRLGLVNRVVPREELDAATLSLARSRRTVSRDPDDEALGQSRVGRGGVPCRLGREHRARRDDRGRRTCRACDEFRRITAEEV